MPRGTELASFVDDEQGHRGRHCIANAWHQSDQGIETEPYVGPRNDENGIQEAREPIKPRDPLASEVRLWKLNIETVDVGCDH